MPRNLIRRLDASVAVALAFLLVVASVAILTTNRKIEALVIGVLVLMAATAAYFVRRVIIRDLRARERAEFALRASEARFAGILAIAADAIVTIDAAGRIVHFNHAAEAMFGFMATDIIGHPLDLLLPERYVEAHRRHVRAFAESGQVGRPRGDRRDVIGRRRDGSEFVAEASLSRLPTSEGDYLTAVVRDVTAHRDRERFEHVLAVASARLATTLNYDETLRLAAALPVPAPADWCFVDVVELDPRGTRTLRRSASAHVDADRDAALREIERRGLDEDAPAEAIDVLRTGEARIHPVVSDDWLEAHTLDPSELADLHVLGVRSCATLPLRSGDRVIGAMTVGTSERAMTPADIELGLALAERIALAIDNASLYRRVQRALKGRDQVLAVVAHDLRTPASAIAMCARTLIDHPPDSPAEQRALQETILEASQWMHRLMQDLLDVASIESGQFGVDRQPIAIGSAVERAVGLFAETARAAGVELDASIADDLPPIAADADRIAQLTGNLISNALRFTPAGGSVAVTVSATPGAIVIGVRDTGAGIEPSHLPHLFDRFWHAETAGVARGTGLGLAIAKGITTAHGGRIWAESSPGRGSSFFAELPVAPR